LSGTLLRVINGTQEELTAVYGNAEKHSGGDGDGDGDDDGGGEEGDASCPPFDRYIAFINSVVSVMLLQCCLS
jgi:hypothetical protein